MLRALAPIPSRPVAPALRPASRPVGAPSAARPSISTPSPHRSVAASAAQGASTVRVSVQGRHLEVTPALKAYAVRVKGERGRRAGFHRRASESALPPNTHACPAP